jgi:hypothetical protein
MNCHGGTCPEPVWCKEEQECLWFRWNKECEKSPNGKHDLNSGGACVFCWDRPASPTDVQR